MQKWQRRANGVWLRLRYVGVILWNRLWFRRVVKIMALFLLFVIVLQFLYPSDRALPFARIDDTSVGWKTSDELMPLLTDGFADASVTITASTQKTTVKLSDTGASLKSDTAADQLTSYPWWQRLLPFSALVRRPIVTHMPLDFNDTKLASAAETLANNLHSEPKNGEVSVTDDGEVTVSAAEDGVTVSTDTLKNALKTTALRFGDNAITVTPQLKPPSVTNDMVNSVKSKLTNILKTKLTFNNSMDASAHYTPDAKTVATWITIGDKLALGINKDVLTAYANDVAQNTIVAAGTTTVTVVDGIEQSRSTGNNGRAVDSDALTDGVSKALLSGGDTTITMKFKTVAPRIVYNRSYTSSQQALQAYINDVSAGQNIEISVQQLTGAGWSASSNASKSVVSASTYKLFISLLLFDRINAGQMQWSDTVPNTSGRSVDQCLYDTIHVSANYCAEEWIKEWGRTAINSALYAKGFSNATTFTASDATHTSAADLQKLLVGLYRKTLFNDADSGKLIDLMKHQVYRSGIPAGSAGTVADKVGFLWDYLNDAAIVYHPRGTYVLVVMTQGQSWGKIAEITKQIETIMYP